MQGSFVEGKEGVEEDCVVAYLRDCGERFDECPGLFLGPFYGGGAA